MSRTENGRPLARTTEQAPNDRRRITPEDVDLKGRALRLYRTVLDRRDVKRRLVPVRGVERTHALLRDAGVRGLERAGEEMIDLFVAGATEADLRLYPILLHELCDDLFVGTARPPRPELEAMEGEADAVEDMRTYGTLALYVAGERETPVDKRERAAALRKQAAASLALARCLEFEARTDERAAGVLPPAA